MGVFRFSKSSLRITSDSSSAIDHLVQLKSKIPGNEDLSSFKLPEIGSTFDIHSFFPLFGKFIYRLTDDQLAVTFATKAVLEYFSNQGCLYLELRTTPRDLNDGGMQGYVEAVRKGFQKYFQHATCGKMVAKLILSIDRRHSKEVVKQVVDLAIEHQDLVVGVDICGDPTKGDARELVDDCSRLKAAGLKLTIHVGEIKDQLTTQQYDFKLQPDRLGHATFLSPESQQFVIENKTPIEICLSSNLICETVASLDEHHLKWAIENEIPVLICTDDSLIFNTNPKDEYQKALALCNPPTNKALAKLVIDGLSGLFCDQAEKDRLRDKINEWLLQNP